MQKYKILNPEIDTNNYDSRFYKTKRDTYASIDPRTYDSARNQYIEFDRPPLDRSVKMKDVYSSKLTNYGKINGNNYSDIKDGSIIYYIDSERANNPFQPVFHSTKEYDVKVCAVKLPTGNVQPEYYRNFKEWKNPMGEIRLSNQSFYEDTQFQRNELSTMYESALNTRSNR